MSSKIVNELDERIKVLEQRKKALEHQLKSENRKNRTRRLIQKGALLEKYLDIEDLTPEETENVLKVVAKFKNKNKEYFMKQLEQIDKNYTI